MLKLYIFTQFVKTPQHVSIYLDRPQGVIEHQ